VFFFSSGAVEERWRKPDLLVNRANVYLGFPLGGALSLGLMAGAAVFLQPAGIQPSHLSDVALPTMLVLGKVGLALLLLAFFIVTFGAAIETALSCGYTIAQYYGWQWGKFVRPAARGDHGRHDPADDHHQGGTVAAAVESRGPSDPHPHAFGWGRPVVPAV
jgi:manganese transport protein